MLDMEDEVIAPPANPGASLSATIYDEVKNVGRTGIVGGLYFDQPVTLTVQMSDAAGGTLRTVKSETLAANEGHSLEVAFMGYRTKVTITTGATPPTVWMVGCRVTSRAVPA